MPRQVVGSGRKGEQLGVMLHRTNKLPSESCSIDNRRDNAYRENRKEKPWTAANHPGLEQGVKPVTVRLW